MHENDSRPFFSSPLCQTLRSTVAKRGLSHAALAKTMDYDSENIVSAFLSGALVIPLDRGVLLANTLDIPPLKFVELAQQSYPKSRLWATALDLIRMARDEGLPEGA